MASLYVVHPFFIYIVLLILAAGTTFVLDRLGEAAKIRESKISASGRLGTFLAITFVFVGGYTALDYAASSGSDRIPIERAYEYEAQQPLIYQNDKGLETANNVVFSPVSQSIEASTLRTLDRNMFHVDLEIMVALPNPPSDEWKIIITDQVETIRVEDIPALAYNFLFNIDLMDVSLPKIIALREKEATTVILTDNATIQGLPMTFNPYLKVEILQYFNDLATEIVKTIGAENVLEIIAGEGEAQADRIAGEFRVAHNMLAEFRKLTKERKAEKQIRNGVYITILEPSLLSKHVANMIMPRLTMFERALQYVTIERGYGSGSIGKAYINSEKRIASFDGSVGVEEASVDGKNQRVTMNNLGFLVAGEDRAVLVEVVYLAAGGRIETYRKLEQMLGEINVVVDG